MYKLFTVILLSMISIIGYAQQPDSVKISLSDYNEVIAQMNTAQQRMDEFEIRMKKFRNQNTTSHLLMLAGATISTLAYISKGSDYEKVMYLGGAVSLVGVGFYFNSYDAFNFRKKTPKIHSLYNK